MDVIKLYQDFHIQFQTEDHKHCRPGWVNTGCPFCTGNPGLHLGMTLDGSHAYCWRCGYQPVKKVLSRILNITEKNIPEIIAQYGGRPIITKDAKVKIGIKKFRLPEPITPLSINHRKYLQKRGFDAAHLERQWNLYGTSVVSRLDGIDYKFRILAPVFWDTKMVTFQARDITERHKLKYMACPKEREIIHHKHLLYGCPEKWKDEIIVTEGITDVWRLGVKAVCTFGIEYTPKQMRLIASMFKRVVVMFDDEPQAINQANKLVSDLKFRGVDAFRVDIKGDPGGMKQDDADHLVKQIL